MEFLGLEKSRAPAPGTRGPAPITGASGRKVGADMTPGSVLYVAAAHSALMSSRAGCDLRGVAAAGQAVMCGPLAAGCVDSGLRRVQVMVPGERTLGLRCFSRRQGSA